LACGITGRRELLALAPISARKKRASDRILSSQMSQMSSLL
jgi:hypothetical protein